MAKITWKLPVSIKKYYKIKTFEKIPCFEYAEEKHLTKVPDSEADLIRLSS